VSIHSTPNIPSFIDDQTTLSSGTSHTTSFKTTTPLIQVCLGGTGNILSKSLATINCLVTNIIQNILFCVKPKCRFGTTEAWV